MNSMNSRQGFAPAIIFIIVAVLAIGGGAYYYSVSGPTEAPQPQSAEQVVMEKKGAVENDQSGVMVDAEKDPVMEKPGDTVMEKPAATSMSFSGTVLAGSSAQLLDFKKADYDKAVASGKLVLLYFYADWCPNCIAEFPKMQSAFNGLTTDNVIGFRVNYKDGATDADETALAKQFGVAYQHTKVFIKNGVLVSKHPDSWDEARYVKEINGRL